MAAYTIEDIELIRSKSGISYQEAVSLLDYHNGNVARALVDLERNGRIRQQSAQKSASSSASAQSKAGSSSSRGGLVELMSKLYRARIKIKKDDVTVVNLSSLFGIAGLIFAPHMLIAGAIVSLVLGYKFSFTKNDPDFAGENLERMVRNAAENVKSSVSDFTRGFQEGANSSAASTGNTASHPYAPSGSQSAGNAQERSYYANPSASAAAYRANVPTMTFPVQVEGQDGSVTVEGDSEGYTSATIE